MWSGSWLFVGFICINVLVICVIKFVVLFFYFNKCIFVVGIGVSCGVVVVGYNYVVFLNCYIVFYVYLCKIFMFMVFGKR